MSALNDAVTRINASVQAEIAAIVARLAEADPDVAAAVTALTALSATLDAETAALAVLPPPPPPPPHTPAGGFGIPVQG